MLLRQLEYLIALAREGHFGRAAQACHVSQPALSAGIRKLESDLRVQIVQRGQRFGGFTPEGAHVLEWAQRMIAEQDALRHALSGMHRGLSGVLRIGAIPTALTAVSLLTTPMRRRHPLVRFSLESMSSRDIVSRLNDFDIDVGMTYIDGEPLGRVHAIPLYRERYLFLTPRTGEFAGVDSISWAEAASASLCLLSPGMQNRRILDVHFAEAGVEVEPVVETDAVSAIYAHVGSMELSSIIPHAWLHGFDIPSGARVLPLPQPRRSFQIGLVLAGRGPDSLLARTLVQTVGQLDISGDLDRTVHDRLKPAIPFTEDDGTTAGDSAR